RGRDRGRTWGAAPALGVAAEAWTSRGRVLHPAGMAVPDVGRDSRGADGVGDTLSWRAHAALSLYGVAVRRESVSVRSVCLVVEDVRVCAGESVGTGAGVVPATAGVSR